MGVHVSELSPGVYRLGTVSNGQTQAFHVLEGPSGLTLVDTGPADFSDTYEAFLDDYGYTFDDVHRAIITHADADHHGGTHELKSKSSSVSLLAHEADAPMIEDNAELMQQRYRRFEDDHGVSYSEELLEELKAMAGKGSRLDVRLRGGESIAVGDRAVRVLHTPGHSRGHIMLYDDTYDLMLGADGFFGRGVLDTDGEFIQPPPYLYCKRYANTIQLVDALNVQTISFTHYDVLSGRAIDEFVEESLDFYSELEAVLLDVLTDRERVTLQEAIDATVDRMGSFGLDANLAYPISAHFSQLEADGAVVSNNGGSRTVWEATE